MQEMGVMLLLFQKLNYVKDDVTFTEVECLFGNQVVPLSLNVFDKSFQIYFLKVCAHNSLNVLYFSYRNIDCSQM